MNSFENVTVSSVFAHAAADLVVSIDGAGSIGGFHVVDIQQIVSYTAPPYSHIVEDVGAEANIISALVCHTDHDRPTSVCGRQVIKQILRHVK